MSKLQDELILSICLVSLLVLFLCIPQAGGGEQVFVLSLLPLGFSSLFLLETFLEKGSGKSAHGFSIESPSIELPVGGGGDNPKFQSSSFDKFGESVSLENPGVFVKNKVSKYESTLSKITTLVIVFMIFWSPLILLIEAPTAGGMSYQAENKSNREPVTYRTTIKGNKDIEENELIPSSAKWGEQESWKKSKLTSPKQTENRPLRDNDNKRSEIIWSLKAKNKVTFQPTKTIQRHAPPKNYEEDKNTLLEKHPNYVEVRNRQTGTLIENIPSEWITSISSSSVQYEPPGKPVYIFDIENVKYEKESENVKDKLDIEITLKPNKLTKTLLKASILQNTEILNENYYFRKKQFDLSSIRELKEELTSLPIQFSKGKAYGKTNIKKNIASLANDGVQFKLKVNLEKERKGYSKAQFKMGSHSIAWTVTSQTDWTSGSWDTSITPYKSPGDIRLIGENAVGFWEFDRGSGDSAKDETDYNNSGTIRMPRVWDTTSDWKAGKFDYTHALSGDLKHGFFDGFEDGSVDIPHWHTWGDNGWTTYTSPALGSFSAGNEDIGDDEGAYISTVVKGPGVLSFQWKVSSEAGYDYLRFWLDEWSTDKSISGEVGWEQKTYLLGEGYHRLIWGYAKDGSVSSGSDMGWIDNVEVRPAEGNHWTDWRNLGRKVEWQELVADTTIAGQSIDARVNVSNTPKAPVSWWNFDNANLREVPVNGEFDGSPPWNLTVVQDDPEETKYPGWRSDVSHTADGSGCLALDMTAGGSETEYEEAYWVQNIGPFSPGTTLSMEGWLKTTDETEGYHAWIQVKDGQNWVTVADGGTGFGSSVAATDWTSYSGSYTTDNEVKTMRVYAKLQDYGGLSGDPYVLMYIDDISVQGDEVDDYWDCNNGLNKGAATGVSGILENAYDFDGGDVVDVGNPSSLQITGDLTLSFWMRPENIAAGRQNPIDKAYGGEFAITLEPDGGMSYYHGPAGAEASPYWSKYKAWPTGTFADNNWYHVVLVRDLSSRTAWGYVNGSQVWTDSWTADNDPAASSEPVTIGDGYAGNFIGKIDEVQIFNSALSGTQVQELYDETVNGTVRDEEQISLSNGSNTYSLSGLKNSQFARIKSEFRTPYWLREDMASAPSGTLLGDAYYDPENEWVRLTRAVDYINGQLEYSMNPGSGFVAEWEFWTGGGDGADAMWLYAYNTSTPTSEDDNGGGYIFAYDEYQDELQVKYEGTTVTSVGQGGIDDSNWHEAKVIVNGTHIRMFLDGQKKIDYYDTTRDKSGGLFGWGARTGGSNNEHRIRNLRVYKYDSFNPSAVHRYELRSAAWTDGKRGSALYFDGQNDYVEVPDDPSLDITGDLTISAWVYPTNISKDIQIIVAKDYYHEYELTMESDGTLRFYQGDGDNWENIDAPDSYTLTENQWNHVTVVRTMSDSKISFYLNGSFIGSNNFTLTPASSTYPVRIGIDRDFISSQHFQGKIDEVADFDRALTENEIKSLWATGTAYWSFNVGNLLENSIPEHSYSGTGYGYYYDYDIVPWGELVENGSLEVGDNFIFEGEVKVDSTRSAAGGESRAFIWTAVPGDSWYRSTSYGTTSTSWQFFRQTFQITDSVEEDGEIRVGVYHYPDDIDNGTSYFRNLKVYKIAGDRYGNNDGTINGATRENSGYYGRSLSFDGTDDYVDVGNVLDVSSTSFTVAAWVKPDQLPSAKGDELAVVAQDVSNDGGYPLLYGDDPGDNWMAYIGGQIDSGFSVDPNEWQFVALTHNKSDNRTCIYKNGKKYTTIASETYQGGAGNPWYIGTDGTVTDDYFDGVVDEVQIYPRTLTSEEINHIAHDAFARIKNGSWHSGIHDFGKTVDPKYLTTDSTLNGQSAEITVQVSDDDFDTIKDSITKSLTGGSDQWDISGELSDARYARAKIKLSTTDTTQTPLVHMFELRCYEDTTDPSTFNLLSPDNNSWTNDSTPTLDWEASSDSSGIDHYQTWYDKPSNLVSYWPASEGDDGR